MRKPSKGRKAFGALLAGICLVLVAALPLQAEEAAAVDPSTSSLDEALTQAERKVEAEPSSAEARVRLGSLLMEKGSLEEAAKAFDGALAIKPRLHEAMTGKGMVLARLDRGQEAEEMLKKALLLNPNPVRTHYELGMLYEKRGDLDQAISEYKKGIEKVKQGRK